MLRRRTKTAQARIAELERRLDHERLYPGQWVNRRIRDRFGNAVQAGPFEGTRFPDWGMTGIDLFSAKVLGTYEHELHAAIEQAIATRPPVTVVIGAAEGYYAAGLGRRLPESRLIAYEPRVEVAQRAAELLELNGVDAELRTEFCTAQTLAADLVGVEGALVVCDCDGPEADILDPSVVPGLRSATIVVEAHDLLVPGVTDRLEAAFAATHDVERVAATPRYVDHSPELAFLPLVSQQLAISEYRGAAMWWLAMRPRQGA